MIIKNPSSADIPKLRDVWKEAFGDTDEFLDLFFSTAFSSERSMCISSDNKIVSALYWFDCFKGSDKIAYIYAVATAASHRSQGLCRKLMNETHQILKNTDYAGAILVPGSKGLFDFYEKLGYKTCSCVEEYKVNANNNCVEITEINAEKYARLRKTYLTTDAVVQEGENLRFLSAFAKFYKGEDFLLAAYKDDITLVGTEILGNTKHLGSIVNALNCTEGFFRTKGDTTPFSMYYPLKNTIPPSYFGLAFD